MSDPVGLTIGVIGLAGQLYRASMICYEIFSDVQDAGTDHDSFHWQLVTEQNRLMRWEKIWGVDSGTLNQKLHPSDYRYRYAVGTLARVVALFASAERLSSKYGLQPVEDSGQPQSPKQKPVKTNSRSFFKRDTLRSDRVWDIFPFLNPRSLEGEPNPANPIHERPPPYSPLPSILDMNALHLLENPSVLQSKNLVPGLKEEIQKLKETAAKMEQSLPIYRKLRWAIIDKPRSIELIKRLRMYNDGLYNVLPAPDTLPQEERLRTRKHPLVSKY